MHLCLVEQKKDVPLLKKRLFSKLITDYYYTLAFQEMMQHLQELLFLMNIAQFNTKLLDIA